MPKPAPTRCGLHWSQPCGYILLITILVAFLEATAQQLSPYQPPVVMGFSGVIRQDPAG